MMMIAVVVVAKRNMLMTSDEMKNCCCLCGSWFNAAAIPSCGNLLHIETSLTLVSHNFHSAASFSFGVFFRCLVVFYFL
jgi:hypothetical protein